MAHGTCLLPIQLRSILAPWGGPRRTARNQIPGSFTHTGQSRLGTHCVKTLHCEALLNVIISENVYSDNIFC